MQKIFHFLNKEIQGLHQAAFLLAFVAIGAKILALFRDRILAAEFGAGKILDIYYASFKIPDFLYIFSLFLVSVTALIPIFLEKKENQKQFLNSIFTVYSALIFLLILITYFLMPYLIPILVPGFSPEEFEILIKLSRILLLSPLFLGLSNLISSVIQSFKRFLIYSLSGILYNFGIILGVLVFYPHYGLKGIMYGVVLGAFLHFSVQIPTLVKLGYLPFFTLKIFWTDIKKVIKLSFARTLGMTMNQIVIISITALASFMAAGSISVFNLAINFESIPIGIIALSYSVAAFPDLAHKYLNKEKEKFFESLSSASRQLIFWLLPATVLFIVLRAQIVRVILGAGAFSWVDTRLTAASLAMLSFSLFAEGLILLLVRAFYAAGKTFVPLVINIISSFSIIFFSYLFLKISSHAPFLEVFFEKIFRVEGVYGVSVLVLPTAYSLGMILNFILLWIFFEKYFNHFTASVKKCFLQMFLISVLIGAVSYFSLNILNYVFDTHTFLGIFLQGFIAGIFGLLTGFFLLKLIKNQELQEIISSLRKKWEKKITPAESEEIL